MTIPAVSIPIPIQISQSQNAVVTPTQVLISLSLLLLTVLLSLSLNLGIASSLLVAAIRCILQLSVMGVILDKVFKAESPWAVAAMSFVMILLGANEVTFARSKRRPDGLFLSSLTSLLASVIPITVFGARLAIVHDPFWSPQSFIPILGMITGNAISGTAVATSVVIKELVDNRDKVETLLAHGASRTEAVVPVAREALRLALLPTVNQMSVIGLISIPGMMTGAILGGESTQRAAQMQMIIMFLITTTTTICVSLSLLFTLSVLVDSGHRIRADRVSGGGKNGSSGNVLVWLGRMGWECLRGRGGGRGAVRI
ncbi:UPF0014-domain-containing protein [Meredithblackwellia eburnea MCA 4105]